MTSKPYFTLLRRDDGNSPWCIEFGDYERKTVSDEMDEYRDNGETMANLRIIKTADDQASINAKVAELNADLPRSTVDLNGIEVTLPAGASLIKAPQYDHVAYLGHEIGTMESGGFIVDGCVIVDTFEAACTDILTRP